MVVGNLRVVPFTRRHIGQPWALCFIFHSGSTFSWLLFPWLNRGNDRLILLADRCPECGFTPYTVHGLPVVAVLQTELAHLQLERYLNARFCRPSGIWKRPL